MSLWPNKHDWRVMPFNYVQNGGELLCNWSIREWANIWTIKGKQEYRSKWWNRHTNKEHIPV